MHHFIYQSKCLLWIPIAQKKDDEFINIVASFPNVPCSQLSTFAVCLRPLSKTYLVLFKKIPQYTTIPLCLRDSAHTIPSVSNFLPFWLGYPFHPVRWNSDFSFHGILFIYSFILSLFTYLFKIFYCVFSRSQVLFEMSRTMCWKKKTKLFCPHGMYILEGRKDKN